jgi:hypothetical protein
MKRLFAVVVLTIMAVITFSGAVIADEGKLSGKVYFDYFHDFSSTDLDSSLLHGNPGQKNGFEITRVYFSYDRDLDETFSIRFLMDVDNAAGAYRPFMKNAYLMFNIRSIQGSKGYVGIVPMPFVSVPESFWGYRSIFKAPMDAFGLGNTADLGISWKGTWSGMYQLEFAISNGEGYKKLESNTFKLVEFRPTVYLMDKAVTASGFVSFKTLNDSSNSTILSGMVGYDHRYFRVGIDVGMNTISKAAVVGNEVKGDQKTFVSCWVILKPTAKLNLLGRFDRYEPNANVGQDMYSYLILGGDYHPTNNVRVIPNMQIKSFEKKDNPATESIDESAPIMTAYVTLEYSW